MVWCGAVRQKFIIYSSDRFVKSKKLNLIVLFSVIPAKRGEVVRDTAENVLECFLVNQGVIVYVHQR